MMDNIFNESEIRREIRNKVPGIYELRIIMTDFYNTKLSAYFDRDDPDTVIDQMLHWRYPENCCINWYLTSNPVKNYCVAREQFNDLRKTRVMTQDDDIEKLSWLALDIDAEHPAGTSATDKEKEAAHEQALQLYRFMDEIGFQWPEIVDSGNGYHLKYGIDLPNDNKNRDFIGSVFDMLHKRFPAIDTSVKNPSRILKLPGTLAMKGRNFTEEQAAELTAKKGRLFEARPYRPAYIIRDPGTEERTAANAE